MKLLFASVLKCIIIIIIIIMYFIFSPVNDNFNFSCNYY
jgi:hypothetical protein